MKKNVIVFGAGKEVESFYSEKFLACVSYIADNDKNKWHKELRGIRILPPDEIDFEKCFTVISPLLSYAKIKMDLEAQGLALGKDFVWGPDWCGNDWLPSAYQIKTWEEFDKNGEFALESGLWDERVRGISDLINVDTHSVMDIGAGGETLRNFLREEVEYYPVDYCKRYADTIVADINRGEFPDICVDCIICSGILEYVECTDTFINNICSKCNFVILSYSPIEFMREPQKRFSLGWKNALTIGQVVQMFNNHGFYLDVESLIGSLTQVVLKFCKKK